MKMKSGQALIEFIIVLPILLLILFAVIDYGRILYEKNKIENIISDVVDMVKAGKSLDDINKIYGKTYNVSIKEENEFINVSVSEEIKVIAPGLNVVLDNPYVIETKRITLKGDISP